MDTLTRAITLKGSNEIKVKLSKLRSMPGSFIVVNIIAEGRNTPPEANAGSDQTVFVRDTVTLDGSKSSDADGDLLAFQWSFVSVPTGSKATLSDPTAVKPTFVVDLSGTYAVQLTVNDGTVESVPDTVVVTTMNSRPVANAGPDQTVFAGYLVTLDGSKSCDVDGDRLTFQWSFVSVPAWKYSGAFRFDGSQADLCCG